MDVEETVEVEKTPFTIGEAGSVSREAAETDGEGWAADPTEEGSVEKELAEAAEETTE